jgi:hypothetical protein
MDFCTWLNEAHAQDRCKFAKRVSSGCVSLLYHRRLQPSTPDLPDYDFPNLPILISLPMLSHLRAYRESFPDLPYLIYEPTENHFPTYHISIGELPEAHFLTYCISFAPTENHSPTYLLICEPTENNFPTYPISFANLPRKLPRFVSWPIFSRLRTLPRFIFWPVLSHLRTYQIRFPTTFDSAEPTTVW